MAAGDIIIPDNTITPEIMQKIAAEVTKLLNTNAKDPGQWEEVTSTNGVTSLPVLQAMGNTYKLVRVAISVLQGLNGREVELQMNADQTAIQWRYVGVAGSDLQPTEWITLIDVSLLAGAPGETPEFRQGGEGLEWKYQSEEDDAWRVLVPIDILKLQFSDLTAENIAEFWRGVPADVMAEFQQPAIDAAADAREATAAAQNVADHPTYIGTDHYVYKYDLVAQEYVKTDIYVKGDKPTLNDFTPEEIATLQKPALDAAKEANTATTNANKATSNADSKAGLANTAATNANTAASEANTAKEGVLDAISEANTATIAATSAALNANNKAALAETAAANATDAETAAASAANNADSKATMAYNAAANANSAAINAGEKAALANAAATNADTKAALAAEKATLADTKATLADTAARNANEAANSIGYNWTKEW